MFFIMENILFKINSTIGDALKELKLFNQAILAKTGWRFIQNQDTLCARLFRGIYFPFGNFLQAKLGMKPSWTWSSILYGRDLILQGYRWNISTGSNVNIWQDPWVPLLPRFTINSKKPPNSNIYLVRDIINSQQCQWDNHKV